MTARPAPSSLWQQAAREHPHDPDARRRRYVELLREHGHVVDRQPGDDGNLPCGWPHRTEGEHMPHQVAVEWPDSAFADQDEAAAATRVALVDAAKALGVGEPHVGKVTEQTIYRDAASGEFTSKEHYAASPETTTSETVEHKDLG